MKKRNRKTEWKLGISQGEKRKVIEITKKMLQQKANIEFIMSVTGLTKEEIEKLK